MATWIGLLRGINVVGKNRLPMKLLTSILADLSCRSVQTYIQSGNVVFQSRARGSAALAEKISREIEARQGFRPQVLLLTPQEFAQAIANNPYPEADGQPNALHLFFLAADAKRPDLDALQQLQAATERFKLLRRVFYLYAPDGIGRSKLAAAVEKRIGVPMTARNWRTVQQIAALVDKQPEAP